MSAHIIFFSTISIYNLDFDSVAVEDFILIFVNHVLALEANLFPLEVAVEQTVKNQLEFVRLEHIVVQKVG
jgi:hypothetical protein